MAEIKDKLVTAESLKNVYDTLNNNINQISDKTDNLPQPDWNQNDTTAADYVKNRPFYTGDMVETELFDVCALADAANISWVQATEGLYQCMSDFDNNNFIFIETPPEVGSDCIVKYNGLSNNYIVQDGTALEDSNIIVLGNVDELTSGNLTQALILLYPYNLIDVSDASGKCVLWSAMVPSDTVPTELKVSSMRQEITKIDKKFLDLPAETDPTVPDWAKQETKPTYTLAEIQDAKQKDFIIEFRGFDSEKDGDILESNLSKTSDSINAVNLAYANGSTFYAKYKNKLIPMTSISYSIVNNIKLVDIINFSYTEVNDSKNAIVYRNLLFTNTPNEMNARLTIRSIVVDSRLSTNSTNPVCNKAVKQELNKLSDQINNLPGDGLEMNSAGALNATWVMNSSTEGSTKKFKITVDDSGTIKTVNTSDNTEVQLASVSDINELINTTPIILSPTSDELKSGLVTSYGFSDILMALQSGKPVYISLENAGLEGRSQIISYSRNETPSGYKFTILFDSDILNLLFTSQ